MNSSMNVHRITSIKVELAEANGHKWTDFVFADGEGNRFSLAVHSADWLPIQGADHINHVTQPVEVEA